MLNPAYYTVTINSIVVHIIVVIILYYITINYIISIYLSNSPRSLCVHCWVGPARVRVFAGHLWHCGVATVTRVHRVDSNTLYTASIVIYRSGIRGERVPPECSILVSRWGQLPSVASWLARPILR